MNNDWIQTIGAIDPIGDQSRELSQFIEIALTRLTVEEFQEAINQAIQCKLNTTSVKDLIQELSKCDQNKKVYASTYDGKYLIDYVKEEPGVVFLHTEA